MREVQFRLIVLVALDDGADDVGLASGLDLLAHKRPDLAGAFGGHAPGGDGGAAGWQLIEDAGLEVAVDGQRQGAGDGRGGHDQDVRFGGHAVRTGFAHQFVALLHAETVLFVHDHEAQVLEIDLFFDQGVRADGQIGFAAKDAAAGLALGAFVERTGEQADAVEPALGGRYRFSQKFAGREIVLRGKDLGGRHQGHLVAVFDGHQRGFKRDDGLAGAHVALQQPAHGPRLAHVADDLAKDPLLRGRGLEGQNLLQRFPHVLVGGEGRALALAQPPAFQLQTEFQVPELFKDQPAMRGRHGGLQVGERCIG